MGVYNLGNDRMLCWDDFFIENSDNVIIKMQKPVRKGPAFEAREGVDGGDNNYASIIKVEDKFRLYYRAWRWVMHSNGQLESHTPRYCLCESDDGITYKRKFLHKHSYDGSTYNNIFTDISQDNLSVCYDENPNCDPNEKFKAFGMLGANHELGHGLGYWVSADGIDFTFKGKLKLPGSFDSYNIALWDKETEQYFIYYRGEHRVDGKNGEFDVVNKDLSIFREIRVATTKDFETFEIFGQLDYKGKGEDFQFYTNNILKYHRCKNMFIGLPTRYVDRVADLENFKDMPDFARREHKIKYTGRGGTALTDCGIITSRDGFHFDRWDEAFLTAGIENHDNWWYGDRYSVYGIYETPSEKDGEPNELSFFVGEDFMSQRGDFIRYTVRLDGFFSWNAGFNGGTVLTKPFIFSGSNLEVNFATSIYGALFATICDEDGNELEGYRSNNLFGDSVDRPMHFQKDLKELEGKPIRLKFFLKDCDLYSFKFN